MKALVYHGNKDLRFEDFPEPEVSERDVRIRIRASGLCHTDFNEYLNGPVYVSVNPHPQTGRSIPLVLGHEFSGEVVETGNGVSSLRTGDRVAVNAIDCCWKCEFCRRGLSLHCPNAAVIGFSRDGGYAEYAVVPESCCYLLRSGVGFRAGALVEPLSVAMHSMKRARVMLGCRAAVIGGGTIGLCTLQTLRICGVSEVYVIEKEPEKRGVAECLGASEFIQAGQCDVKNAIFDKTSAVGVDFAFECVGSESALNTALAITRPGGTVCLTGVMPGAIEFNWNDVLAKEKEITTTNAYYDEYPTVISMLADGRLKWAPLITEVFPLEDAAKALTHFEDLGKRNIKMLIEI